MWIIFDHSGTNWTGSNSCGSGLPQKEKRTVGVTFWSVHRRLPTCPCRSVKPAMSEVLEVQHVAVLSTRDSGRARRMTLGVVKVDDSVRDSRKQFGKRFGRRESAIRRESCRIAGAPLEEHRPPESRFPALDSPANNPHQLALNGIQGRTAIRS